MMTSEYLSYQTKRTEYKNMNMNQRQRRPKSAYQQRRHPRINFQNSSSSNSKKRNKKNKKRPMTSSGYGYRNRISKKYQNDNIGGSSSRYGYGHGHGYGSPIKSRYGGNSSRYGSYKKNGGRGRGGKRSERRMVSEFVNLIDDEKSINEIKYFEPSSKIFGDVLKDQNSKINFGLIDLHGGISKKNFKKIKMEIDDEIRDLTKKIRIPSSGIGGIGLYKVERIKEKIFEKKQKMKIFSTLLHTVDHGLVEYEKEMKTRNYEKTLSNDEINELILNNGEITKGAIINQSKMKIDSILEKQQKVAEERKKLIKLLEEKENMQFGEDYQEVNMELSESYQRKNEIKDCTLEISQRISILKTRLAMSILKMKDLFVEFTRIRKNDSSITLDSLSQVSIIAKELQTTKKNLGRTNIKINVLKEKLLEREKEISKLKILYLKKDDELKRIKESIKNAETNGDVSSQLLRKIKEEKNDDDDVKIEILDAFDPKFRTTEELLSDVSIVNDVNQLKKLLKFFITERGKVVYCLSSVHEKVEFLKNHFDKLNESKPVTLKDNFVDKWIELSLSIDKILQEEWKSSKIDSIIDDNEKFSNRQMVERMYLNVLKNSSFENEKFNPLPVANSITGLLLKIYYCFRISLFSDSKTQKKIRKSELLEKFADYTLGVVRNKKKKKVKSRLKVKKKFESTINEFENKKRKRSRSGSTSGESQQKKSGKSINELEVKRKKKSRRGSHSGDSQQLSKIDNMKKDSTKKRNSGPTTSFKMLNQKGI